MGLTSPLGAISGPQYIGQAPPITPSFSTLTPLQNAWPDIYQEFANLYQLIQFPQISTGTAQNLTIANNLIINGTMSGTATLQKPISVTTIVNTATTSSVFQNTHLTASIIPSSATRRVKITVTGTGYVNAAGKTAYFTIARGSTNLGSAVGFTAIVTNAGGALTVPVAISFMDSPATASSVSYTLQVASQDNATDVEFPSFGGTCSMILEEAY